MFVRGCNLKDILDCYPVSFKNVELREKAYTGEWLRAGLEKTGRDTRRKMIG
jgi:hypothetical protein